MLVILCCAVTFAIQRKNTANEIETANTIYSKNLKDALNRHKNDSRAFIRIIDNQLSLLEKPPHNAFISSETVRYLEEIRELHFDKKAKEEYRFDTQLWEAALQIDDISSYKAYIKQCPNGFKITEAKNKIETLEQE